MNLDHYNEAKKADTEWHLALEAKFGKQAGDARYDKRGVSTPELKALRDAKIAADAKLFSR
jgi:hypothetical protein